MTRSSTLEAERVEFRDSHELKENVDHISELKVHDDLSRRYSISVFDDIVGWLRDNNSDEVI